MKSDLLGAKTFSLTPDIVALFAIVILVLTQYLSPAEGFSGFSSPAIITMLGMFFLSSALKETGVSDQLGRFIARIGGTREFVVVAAVMLVGALFSAFMHNIAVTALFLPAVMRVSRDTAVSPSKLLVPLAFGVLLGGMTTPIGTPTNMIILDVMRNSGMPPFHYYDFFIPGIAVTVVGILYVVLVGRRLLPGGAAGEQGASSERRETPLSDIYRLRERLSRFLVPAESPLVGVSLGDAHLQDRYGARVVAIERGGQRILMPEAAQSLSAGDALVLSGRAEELATINPSLLTRHSDRADPNFETHAIGVLEVILSPRSRLIDKKIAEIKFFERYGFLILAIWRNGEPIRSRLSEVTLQFGDALLLQGPRTRISLLSKDEDFVVVSESPTPLLRKDRAPYAIFGFLAMILLSTTGIQPIEISALVGALLVVLCGAITMDEVYRRIEWRVVTLVACLYPLAIAAEKAGILTLAVQELGTHGAHLSPWLLCLSFGVVASLLSQLLDSPIAVMILSPVVLSISKVLHLSERPLLMMITLGASVAFMTPYSSKSTLLVMSPGGYRTSDFLKIGTPLTILVLVTLSFVIPEVLPFEVIAPASVASKQ